MRENGRWAKRYAAERLLVGGNAATPARLLDLIYYSCTQLCVKVGSKLGMH